MTTDPEVAWAAGVFDGDGSICGYVPHGRRAQIVQVTVYQATTPVLERFRIAMDGHGGIYGPYRGRLYHWTTKRREAVGLVCSRLWPFLGAEKRAQVRSALGDPTAKDEVQQANPASWRALDAGWAAGFFDAEGSVTISVRGSAVLEIPQAEVDGAPSSCLLRFREIVRVGRIDGPRIVPSPWSKKPQYRWVAASRSDVETVLALIRPLVSDEKRAALDRVSSLSLTPL